MIGDQSPGSPVELSDREYAGLMDPIDHERCRYPYCIVWTPIPFLTWMFPILGHMGICTSSGVIRDFAGPYCVSEDQTKDNPLMISYIRLLKVFLWSLGAWPAEVLGEKLPSFFRYYRVYVPLQSFIVFFGQVYYLFKYSKTMSFFLKGHCYIAVFLCILTVIRSSLPNLKKYGQVIRMFLMAFHLLHFKHKNESYKKIYNMIEKVSMAFTLFLLGMMVLGMTLFNISPIYQNYKSGAFSGNRVENSTLEFSVYYEFPGFNIEEKFFTATLFNFVLCYNCSITLCSYDVLLSLMVFQIIGHIQVLRYNLNDFPKPKKQTTVKVFNMQKGGQNEVVVEMYDIEENMTVHKMLAECINHHKLIVKFTEELSSFFGPMLAVNYLLHLVSCCLLLLECSQGDTDAIVRFGPLTFIVFGQLIQISTTFEVVDTVSEKLKDDVYFTPWEYMDKKNRRTVCILLNRVQTPIRVNAVGVVSVGVTTMAGILKTTFSYFTFLRSMDY